DIALGALFERPSACAEGAAYALWDLPTGTSGTINAHNPSSARLGGEVPGNEAGNTMAGIGDFNGDGFADFIVGSNNSFDLEAPGDFYLILGTVSGVTSQSLESLTRATGGVNFRCRTGEYWNPVRITGAGDFN